MAEAIEKQYTAEHLTDRQNMLLALAKDAVRNSPASQTQVRIFATDSALTRFANSTIHQNTFERDVAISVTARDGQREGSAATNVLTPEAIAETVAQAHSAAKVSQENPDLADFPPGPREYATQAEYYEATAACTPEDRARLVIKGFEVCEDGAFEAAGILTTNQSNFAVVNSNGIEAAYNTTSCKYSVRWQGEDSSGYEEGTARNVGDLDIEELALKALAMARRSAEPQRDLPAGKYTVVLSPECTTTMLNTLTMLGFSGKDYLDGSSFMVGKMGEPVTGTQITITDDPLDPRTLGLPCDAAGVPKQRLALIDSGVARGVAHDANSAKRAGTASTGHDSGWNRPLATNLVLAPGNSNREEIIGKVKRGVYISRFHYTNIVDPMNTVITGMTRDGTMLIENGEMTRGLTNFRFTQNVLQALANAEEISGDQVFYGSFWSFLSSGCLVPDAMLVNDFNFSGKTDF